MEKSKSFHFIRLMKVASCHWQQMGSRSDFLKFEIYIDSDDGKHLSATIQWNIPVNFLVDKYYLEYCFAFFAFGFFFKFLRFVEFVFEFSGMIKLF